MGASMSMAHNKFINSGKHGEVWNNSVFPWHNEGISVAGSHS